MKNFLLVVFTCLLIHISFAQSPDIVSHGFIAFHDKNVYRIDVWANITDPNGQNDITTIKAIAPDGRQISMSLQSGNFYYGNSGSYYGQGPLPLGSARIIAVDKSANTDTASYNISNVIEELPTIRYPQNGKLVTGTNPIFDWDDVHDSQSPISYEIHIFRDDWTMIWNKNNLSSSEARYNFDGNATEPLQYGKTYFLEVYAIDNWGNQSYDLVSFDVGQYLILENSYVKVEFNPNRPAVYKYTYKINGEILYGDLVNEMFTADVFYGGTEHWIMPIVNSIKIGIDSITYHLVVKNGPLVVSSFDLTYKLENSVVKLRFNNVQEIAEYKFINVRSSDLVTVKSTQTGATLIFPESGGRLIDVQNANPGYEEINLDLDGWWRPMLNSMLYHQGLASAIEYDHLDMMLWTRITQNSSEGKLATIGMIFNYRYAPTDLSKAAFIDVFDSVTNSLTVNINIISDYDNDNDVDWIDGAKCLRDQINMAPDTTYIKSYVSKLGIGGIEEGPFTDYLKTIKKLYNLTDRNKSHLYLIDYGPATWSLFGVPDDLWPRWSLEDLKEVFRVSEESYDSFLSFHDNFTDYYPGTPGYDPDLRVINPDGTPFIGWPLPQFSNAFRMDTYDYVVNYGIDRIKSITARYPIKQSYHIDVLSVVFPKDYSINSSSSRERNRRGVKLIVDEFNKVGVDVTSEGLTSQFVESGMGFFLHIPRYLSHLLSFGNQIEIPLIEFLYHGKSLYGLLGEPSGNYLDPILCGACSWGHIHLTNVTTWPIEEFYLVDLPWMSLNQRYMNDYTENGSKRKVIYDNDTFVETDYASNTYTVQVDGKIIGQNYTTTYTKDENTFLIYSRDAKTINVPLPDKWSEKIFLQKLTEEGPEGGVAHQLVNRNIVFNAEAGTPYKIIRNDSGSIQLPTTPKLILPANNSLKQSPTFRWESSDLAEYYRLQVALENSFANPVFDDSTITTVSITVTQLNDNTKYYWRICARNAAGNSSWSEVWSFTTQKNFEAEIQLGLSPTGNGIRQTCNESDGSYKTTVVGNSPCVYNWLHNSSPYEGHYLYFNLDDNLVYAGSSPNCWIMVEYYDTSASGAIALEYDSPGASLQNKYKYCDEINVSNARTWKSKTFDITDAYFSNRENGGSDFRFYNNGAMFLRRVYVSSYDPDITVPIELVSFTGAFDANAVKLEWTTATETNNKGFEIERLQSYGIESLQDWEKIGFVEGKGTTININEYSFVDKLQNVPAQTKSISYRLKQIDLDGNCKYSNTIGVVIDILPREFVLYQNYPNPFNPTTKIKYSMPQASFVTIKVFNVLGKEVETLVNEEKPAGNYDVEFSAKGGGPDLPSGVYFYRMQAARFIQIKKFLLLK